MSPTLLLIVLTLGAEPRPLDLPGTFSGVQREDILLALYPKWDPATRRLGEGRSLKVRGKPVPVEHADLWEADVWLEPPEKEKVPEHLVALVSTFTYRPGEPGDSLEDRDPRQPGDAGSEGPGTWCDLAVLDHVEGKLQVRALQKDAFPCGGSAFPVLDVATRVIDSTPVFGIRLQQARGGATDVTLHLLSLDRKKGFKAQQRITEEITLTRGWTRLEGAVRQGQPVRIRASTAAVPRSDGSERRPEPGAPFGALVCRVAGSGQLNVARWPAEAEAEAELILRFTADRKGPLECRINAEQPPESTFLEIKLDEEVPPPASAISDEP